MEDQVSEFGPRSCGPSLGGDAMTGWIAFWIFVAAVGVLIAMASWRQRRHGGSRAFGQTANELGRSEFSTPHPERRLPDKDIRGPTSP